MMSKIDALREPPESKKKAARQGLIIRDWMLVMGLMAMTFPGLMALGYYGTKGHFLDGILFFIAGIGFILLRTYLKPPKNLWERISTFTTRSHKYDKIILLHYDSKLQCKGTSTTINWKTGELIEVGGCEVPLEMHISMDSHVWVNPRQNTQKEHALPRAEDSGGGAAVVSANREVQFELQENIYLKAGDVLTYVPKSSRGSCLWHRINEPYCKEVIVFARIQESTEERP